MSDDAKARQTSESAGSEPGINKGLVAGIVAALTAAAVALAYFLNLVSDQVVGILAAGAFTLVLALMVLKVGLDLVKPHLRYASFALVLGIAFVALYPATVALHLGHPDASATLDETHQTLELASGGSYHVLVSGKLAEARESRISYQLRAGESLVDGALERQYATRRARRGPGIQVPEDHELNAHEVRLPAERPVLVLQQITAGQRVLVRAFSMLPMPVLWALMALVALLGMFVEAKAPSSGTVVMAGAAAVCFGLIIDTADQRSVVLGTLAGAMLAAGGGAVLGTVLGAIGRRFFKPEAAGPKGSRPPDPEDRDEKPGARPAA